MKRRQFITLLGGAAAWPLAARAQQPAMPVIAFISGRSASASTSYVTAFRRGLVETGYVEGQNTAVEYNWLEGQYDRLPALLADLINRRVNAIVTPGSTPAAVAAKAATATIPIVFSVAQDPVRLGLVASLSHPGGNATGINFFAQEVAAKRLRLLHDLVPKAERIAVIVNPANASSAENNLREVQQAAPIIGLQIAMVLKATGLVAFPNPKTTANRASIIILAARHRLPAIYPFRFFAIEGGLMSYGIDQIDQWRGAATYVDRILRGEKPGDLPVQAPTKFELVINLKTAKATGLHIPPAFPLRADEVIE